MLAHAIVQIVMHRAIFLVAHFYCLFMILCVVAAFVFFRKVVFSLMSASVSSVNGDWTARTPSAVIGGRRSVDGMSTKCLDCIDAFNLQVMPKNLLTDPVTKQVGWLPQFWTIFDFPEVCGISKAIRPVDLRALFDWQLAAISRLRTTHHDKEDFQAALSAAETRMQQWRLSHVDDQFAFLKVRARARSPSGMPSTPLREKSPSPQPAGEPVSISCLDSAAI